MGLTTRRIAKGFALLCLVGVAVMLFIKPTETIITIVAWLPSLIILGILGSIVVWDTRYERKKEKERGK